MILLTHHMMPPSLSTDVLTESCGLVGLAAPPPALREMMASTVPTTMAEEKKNSIDGGDSFIVI